MQQQTCAKPSNHGSRPAGPPGHPQETVFSHAWELNSFPGDRPPFGSGGSPQARPEPDVRVPPVPRRVKSAEVSPESRGLRRLPVTSCLPQTRRDQELPRLQIRTDEPPLASPYWLAAKMANTAEARGGAMTVTRRLALTLGGSCYSQGRGVLIKEFRGLGK